MYSPKLRLTLLVSSLVVAILACGTPSSTEAPSTAEATASSIPSVDTIQHQTIPVSLPVDRASHAGDYDSSKGFPGGDRFTYERFERPYNANTMDIYFAEIDIIDTSVFQDDTWIYGKIIVKGNESNTLSGKYAMELDTDLDGKGDWLVLASSPSSKDWTTNGVQVYEDANNDVGSVKPMFTDEKVTGDGFEKLVFDQGNGADIDSAWVRVAANTPNIIEFSVKRSVLGNPEKYLIGMWAGNALLDPALFDINDHFTHEQAGEADPGLDVFYPAKEVSEIDNSCRMAVGFQPTGQEPGLCETLAPANSGGSCQSTPTQVLACSINSDPSYSCSWNKNSCKCDCKYVGPK